MLGTGTRQVSSGPVARIRYISLIQPHSSCKTLLFLYKKICVQWFRGLMWSNVWSMWSNETPSGELFTYTSSLYKDSFEKSFLAKHTRFLRQWSSRKWVAYNIFPAIYKFNCYRISLSAFLNVTVDFH